MPGACRHDLDLGPARHLGCATALGADVRGAASSDAGEVLATTLPSFMRATGLPEGLSGVGYDASDLDALAERAIVQRRLVDNAPCAVDRDRMRALFEGALDYRGPGDRCEAGGASS